MVGEDADRGTSRKATRTGVWGAHRHDLEAGSLANWSRALDGQRRELLAGVGHELKTPLSIVLGLCGRLLNGDALATDHTQDVERIRANAYVLLKRVDELLQVSRIEGGRLTLELGNVDVAQLVRCSCEGFQSVAELRAQRLVVEAPDALWARLDEEKVLSVVSNLLANALRHAPRGGLVRCTVTEVGERLRIEVADDGPGVAAGLRKQIFERYEQGAPNGRRAGGSGLGLAIVRDLVALHKGTVALSDAPEGGALFVVDMPLVAPARRRSRRGAGGANPVAPALEVAERQRATVERLRAEVDADGRRTPATGLAPSDRAHVLVVTADAELGAFAQELIGDDFEVEHAGDPLEAVRAIAARRPDVVLLDAATGSGALMAICRRLGDVPLLALTASADDIATLMSAGALDCLVQPFETAELRARLTALIDRGRDATRRTTALGRLERAFQAAPVPMALVSADGRMLQVNRALCRLLGRADTDLLEHTVEDLTHPDDLPDEAQRRRLVLGRRLIADRGTWRLARADGSYVRVSAATSLVSDGEGEDCLLWHLTEVAEEQHRRGAGVLAGPPGRRAFERAVRHQLLRCRRYGEEAALVRCSLDELPEVAAAHGSEVADRLVAAILDAVRRRLRSTDVVAYIGDHEIAALLAHSDLDAATTTATAMREAAESQRVVTADGSVGTAAEVGAASLTRSGSPGRAFVDAGLALQARGDAAARVGRFRRPVRADQARAR
jgi:PAS domain S-box-containing protein/diguanylate cyclase (GGDEF)-like protein